MEGQKIIPIASIAFTNIKDEAAKEEITRSVFDQRLDNSKTFIGFKITTIYDFFMLFVFMAGIAAVILFFLSKKLMVMMHEEA